MKKKNNNKQIEKLLPKAYRPLSAWGYFWRSVLYAIPVIGWIVLLVKAIGAKNRNVRNYARSYFCGLLIAVIIAVLAVAAYFIIYAVTGKVLVLAPGAKKAIWDVFYKFTSLIPL